MHTYTHVHGRCGATRCGGGRGRMKFKYKFLRHFTATARAACVDIVATRALRGWAQRFNPVAHDLREGEGAEEEFVLVSKIFSLFQPFDVTWPAGGGDVLFDVFICATV